MVMKIRVHLALDKGTGPRKGSRICAITLKLAVAAGSMRLLMAVMFAIADDIESTGNQARRAAYLARWRSLIHELSLLVLDADERLENRQLGTPPRRSAGPAN